MKQLTVPTEYVAWALFVQHQDKVEIAVNIVVHRNWSDSGQNLYLRDTIVLKFIHVGANPGILGVVTCEHDDRRSPMLERNDRRHARRYHLLDEVHVCIAPSVDPVIFRSRKKRKFQKGCRYRSDIGSISVG